MVSVRRSPEGNAYKSTIATSDTAAMLTNTRAGRLSGIISILRA